MTELTISKIASHRKKQEVTQYFGQLRALFGNWLEYEKLDVYRKNLIKREGGREVKITLEINKHANRRGFN